ncbi:MAG: 16S rRNA (guanine(527)-N(7))-methyltransferase RsmG [bacterium]
MEENKLKELLRQGVEELGITLNNPKIRLFFIYLNTLKVYNQEVHVTGIKTSQEIIIKHFLDSLTCSLGFTPANGMNIIDIGTGAGFPGVPLKICYPEINLTLLDSSEKHVEFLYRLKKQLQIEFEILLGRTEDFGRKEGYRQRYDLVLARAVAKLNTLVECALPFLKIGGLFISQKGLDIKDELIQAQKAIDILGGRFKEQRRITLPIVQEDKNLVIIEKIKSTPSNYPRRPGIPQKKPL